ncbi:toll/interleukin-1 receptor domain-containing protein [Candidatus Acetothermia bacterium]|nr:toll/interleukin-1 receptor domain-containing protein [Candidatus Acetothermia bacterium]MBI3643599.1 toll/interleukin-1 receptor domain-containing protein [Candidatus Acetothermia bacterium]
MEEAGHTTILQAWDFRPGSNFVLEMQKASSEAKRTIAVLSPDYLTSNFTQPEWAQAFAKDPTGELGLLLPIRVKECDPKGLLPQIIYIDLLNFDETKAKQILLEGIKRGRAKPQKKPDFPGKKSRSVATQPRFPGSLPSHWNIPHRQNPNFTGRDDLLQNLRDSLTLGKNAALTQAIHGLGGVGKSQAATEYAYRHARDYDIVWWIHAEKPETLAADYAQLVVELDLPEKRDAKQTAHIAAVRNWLNKNRDWLLIFDNAEDPVHLKEFLPQMQVGHVIITSKNPNWRGVATPLKVEIWTSEESANFLLTRTGQTDDKAVIDLAKELGYLPLALEQAGAYIEETGIPISNYLDQFQNDQRILLEQDNPPSGYEATIATTWNLSLERIAKESPTSIDLIKICSFLAPDNIPLSLFKDGHEFFQNNLKEIAKDPHKFDLCVAALRKFSLIDRNEDQISIHRLVQSIIQNQLSSDEKGFFQKTALEIMNLAFPSESHDFTTWKTCAYLLPHALKMTNNYEDSPEQSLGKLVNHLGRYFFGKANYTDARKNFVRAINVCEIAFGPDHPDFAIALNDNGLVFSQLGDYRGARPLLERALKITEAALGPDHPDTATRLGNLAGILKELGELKEARPLAERALKITEAALGPDHPDTGTCLDYLAGILKDLGEPRQARPLAERALKITEAALGPDHPDTATRLGNLAGILRELGELKEARPLAERALKIAEAALGPDHPDTAAILNTLALVLKNLGDLNQAKVLYERALKIKEAAFEPDHPTIATTLNNLASVLQDLGNSKRAKILLLRAAEIYKKSLGVSHSSTITVMKNLRNLK